MRYFPLVGALVGVINVAVWWLCRQWFPPAVAVGLALCASLLVTGAFHEDGFADTCDGLGGGATRERALAIMKDSRIGAYGTIGVVMLLGMKWSALVALPAEAFALVVVSAHVVSRWCAIGLVWALPYARPDAAAKSRPFDGALSAAGWAVSGLLGALSIGIFAVCAGLTPEPHRAVAEGAGLAAAALAAVLAAAYFKRRIGGYTGDCLGAAQQLSELAFVLSALAVLRAAGHPG